MRRLFTVLIAAVLAVGGAVLGADPALASGPSRPAAWGHPAPPLHYVALGDSYSSAAGVYPQVPGTVGQACSRSLLNYAHDIAALTRPASFTDVTCSGAKTADFFTPQYPGLVPPQLDAVTSDTRLVTMTIGGNDEDMFITMLIGCITASYLRVQATHGDITGNPCEQQFGSTFTDEIQQQTYWHLVDALNAVHAKAAPGATVVILGYPRILPDFGVPSCYAAMPISMGDVPYMTKIEEVLNAAVKQAAVHTGSRFVDMWPSSRTHDACRPFGQRWIEPYNGNVNAAQVHPNALGEAAMAAQTLLHLGR